MSNPAESVRLASTTGQLFHSLFAVLFPDQCRLCAEPLEELTRVPVCRRCLEDLRPLPPGAGLCHCCGIPREVATWPLCARCAAGEFDFQQARSFGAYEGALRHVVHLFKYQGMRPLAAPLATRLAAVFHQQQWDGAAFAGLVAVPLARELGRQLGLPVLGDTCRRVRATALQTGLTRAQRLENVRGSFAPGPRGHLLAGRDILLIDDVLTTGATLSACARTLRRAGARRICALTVARTVES